MITPFLITGLLLRYCGNYTNAPVSGKNSTLYEHIYGYAREHSFAHFSP